MLIKPSNSFSGILLLLLLGAVAGQLSDPISKETDVDVANNKFLQREAHLDTEPDHKADDEIRDNTCPQNLAVRWHTELSSSVVATPIITDLFSDGRRDIIVPGFSHAIEIVEGPDGAKDPTFQARHHSTLHTSPLLYDADFDGVQDILAATYEGEILFFKDNGEEAAYRMTVPRLRVKREWYVGLNEDPIGHENPDVGAGDDTGEFATARRRLMQVDENAQPQDGSAGVEQQAELTEEAAESFNELFGEDDEPEQQEGGAVDNNVVQQEQHPDGAVQDEQKDTAGGSKEAGQHVLHEEDYEEPEEVEQDYGDYNVDGDGDAAEAEAEAEGSNELDGESLDYHGAGMWDYHDFEVNDDEKANRQQHYVSPYAYVDAHFLATPAIADIDGDGREELVAAVTYFYDPEDYTAGSPRSMWLGEGIDTSKYVASGVVVFDLHTRATKWSQHLDLSTADSRFRADVYATPTLADIDGDGKLEVIIGTSMGFLYVLNATTGDALEGWPVQMGEIQGQAAVADVNGDGKLEIIVGDQRGSVAAFQSSARELWERHLGSAISAAPMLGDVDGDGELEVVVGSYDGRIHVLDGRTGKDVQPFPYRTFGHLVTPILLTKLDNEKRAGLQLIVVAGDGVLYVVDGVNGCADSLDVGEPSRAMVLADDLAGSGRLDLLVTTTGGTLYGIRTAAKYQPLKSWTSQTLGGSAPLIARWNWEGVYTMAESRTPRDVRGEFVPVRFKVVDRRPKIGGVGKLGPYKVSATLQGVGIKDMNAGDRPVIGMSDTVNSTGTFVLEVPCPRTRTTATIRVEMRDELGLVYWDEFTLSFHMHFYRLLKWMAIAPFVFTAVAILAFSSYLDHTALLPS